MRIFANPHISMNEKTQLPQLEELTKLHADICYALADPRRIQIIYALFEKVYTVNDLAAELDISQPSASRHLKILRERGLVETNRSGTSIEYRLTDHRLVEALDLLRSVLKDRLEYRIRLFEEPASE